MEVADVFSAMLPRESVMNIHSILSFFCGSQKPFPTQDETIVLFKSKSVEVGFNSVADILSSVRWALYYGDGNQYSSLMFRLADYSSCLVSSLRDVVTVCGDYQCGTFASLVDSFAIRVGDLAVQPFLDTRTVSSSLLKKVDDTFDEFYRIHCHYANAIKPCLMSHVEGYVSRDRRWRIQFVSRFVFIFVLFSVLFLGGRSAYLAMRSSFIIPVDLLHTHSPQGFQVGGLSPVETYENVSFRWGYGPKTIFAFNQDKSRSLLLEMTVSSIIPGQILEVSMNGNNVGQLALVEAGDMMKSIVSKSFALDTKPGLNVISIQYKYWNGNGVLVSDADQRFFAVPYLRLKLVNVIH